MNDLIEKIAELASLKAQAYPQTVKLRDLYFLCGPPTEERPEGAPVLTTSSYWPNHPEGPNYLQPNTSYAEAAYNFDFAALHTALSTAAVSLTEREAGEETLAKLSELAKDMRTVKLDDFQTSTSRVLALQGAIAAFCAEWDRAQPLLRGAASPTRKGSSEEAEVAGYHSVELADISSIITWLHAQNKPMGELLRRFFSDARQGKVIKECNDIDPLPQP